MARKRKPVVEPLSAQQDQDAQTEEAQAAASKAMAIIERLEVEVQAKCQQLQRMADDASVSLRNEYTIQLMKLPKKVRTLPLKRFQEEYAGDIEAALLARVTERLAASETAAAPPSPTAAEGVPAVAKTTRKGRATRLATAPATTTRGRAAHARAAATPAAASNAGMSAPGTVRAPKPGETFYSQTGSPLEMDAGVGTAVPAARLPHAALVGGTVLKGSQVGTVLAGGAAMPGAATVFTQNQRGRTKASQQHTIVVTVGDGRQVVMTEGALKNVPRELRAEVQEKLMQLYRTVASVVQPK